MQNLQNVKIDGTYLGEINEKTKHQDFPPELKRLFEVFLSMQKPPFVKESLLTNKQEDLKKDIMKLIGPSGWLGDEPISETIKSFIDNDEVFRTNLMDEILSNWVYLVNEWIDITKAMHKENKEMKLRIAGMKFVEEKKAANSSTSDILKRIEI